LREGASIGRECGSDSVRPEHEHMFESRIAYPAYLRERARELFA
jgi:hypothetical protein